MEYKGDASAGSGADFFSACGHTGSEGKSCLFLDDQRNPDVESEDEESDIVYKVDIFELDFQINI